MKMRSGPKLIGQAVTPTQGRTRNEPAASFLAVNVDEERAGVASYVKEEQWKIPVVWWERLAIRNLPECAR